MPVTYRIVDSTGQVLADGIETYEHAYERVHALLSPGVRLHIERRQQDQTLFVTQHQRSSDDRYSVDSWVEARE